jgi:3'-phosphoadenosine 5'-phosphosulfate sulfotransferase (PAPS reductase)/FAD synthetase
MIVHGVKKRDFKTKPLEVLSFGGGVQSFAMLLMIKEGILPKPDIIIHSDTGSEMPHTKKIISAGKDLSFEMDIPFLIVKSHRGALHDDYMRLKAVPVIGVRSCTSNFKIFPQRRAIREIVGKSRGHILAYCWLGITTDESKRQIKSELKWIDNKFPLLELDYSRNKCIELNLKYGFNVQKSGCFCCPYVGKKGFVKLFNEHPDLFKICVEMEELYHTRGNRINGLVSGLKSINSLSIPSLVSFGAEILTEEESSCESGGCFL